VGVPLGLQEIQSEDVTSDGYPKNDISDSDISKKVTRAVDGIKLNGLHMQKAYKAGVTTSVSQPLTSSDLLSGVSVAVHTGIKNTLLDTADTVVTEEASLNFVIQHGGSLTVSQQMTSIRNILESSIKGNATASVFVRAAQGKLPVVVQVDNKDEIASILRIKNYMLKTYDTNVQFVILGGAESHLVARHLSRLDVPVVLMPARCYATTWHARECLTGPPYTDYTVLDVLLKNKVRVGLGSTDVDNGDARNLIWEAGWNLAHNPHLDQSTAVGLVTWSLADIFGLVDSDSQTGPGMLKLGGKADFVAYNNNPFEFGTRVLMVNGGSHSGPVCFPKQF
jgi:hypothetical protein